MSGPRYPDDYLPEDDSGYGSYNLDYDWDFDDSYASLDDYQDLIQPNKHLE